MSFEAENEGEEYATPDVAVIGMSGRFPGSDGVEAFWRNLREGVECITFFTPEELRAAGVPREEREHPDYVPAFGALKGIDLFDAGFWGYSPREAETLEPAHRFFLECAWEAMEDAGYDPARVPGAVGVFAAAANPYYTESHVRAHRELSASVGEFQLTVGSAKDFLATRTSYKLDLRGPSMSVQTGCSSSLVAVHLAAQALLRHECDLALAGGTSVVVPQGGYLYAPGGISSPDGHCRAFDERSAGVQGGNGTGVVTLKRLDDAIRDGDRVRAVIRGSAVNNDGSVKVAFTAPSVAGQAAVIREALEVSGVDPETIGFVEGHGSGTDLGDPIEVAALTQAYRSWTDRKQYAALGSVKTNLGHLDTAAGIAGFIKTVLAVEHGEVPPTLHFERPNPRIDFAGSPFFVSGRLAPWPETGEPRRAGVSSFGIGGTNAHVVLEEAPAPRPSAPRRTTHVLVLSARTPASLEMATDRLAAHLRRNPDLPLADVAWTLQQGRRAFPLRRVLVVRDGEDAAALLEARHPERVLTADVGDGHRSIAFLFPGLGDQYPGMSRGLYDAEPAFRAEVDRCAEILRPRLGLDIREVIFPASSSADEGSSTGGFDFRRMVGRDAAAPDPAAERLNRTELAQPAVFVIEYALAKLWMSFGVVPDAVVGHSLGEYVAAAVAGVFSLEDALALVAERARLVGSLPGGAMLAVPLSPEAVAPYLAGGAVVAAVNAPELCVVAGPEDAVEAVRAALEAAGIAARRIAATHAFHSPMMDAAVEPLAELVGRMTMRAPSIPLVSNVTGTWLTAAEATDARYWSRHLREPVRFDRGAAELLRGPGRILLEVGPGQTLSTFVRQAGEAAAGVPAIPSLRYPYDRTADLSFLLGALGRLWLAGAAPDWEAFHAGERLNRARLPTYPWDRQRYWVEAPSEDAADSHPAAAAEKRGGPSSWAHLPSWRRSPAVRAIEGEGRILVFVDDSALSAAVLDEVRLAGREIAIVRPGERFEAASNGAFTVRPGSREDHRKLVDALADAGGIPATVLHLWGATGDGEARGGFGVGVLADALGRRGEAELIAVAAGMAEVTGAEALEPVRAGLLGALPVLAQEYPALTVRAIDVERPASEAEAKALAARIAAEALSGRTERVVALRGRGRWVRGWDAVPASDLGPVPLRDGGVYLLVGGLRGRNDRLAEHLVRTRGAKLALLDPTLPHRGQWDAVVRARLAEDPLRRQIERVRELEAGGAEILTLQVVPSEAAQVVDALRMVDERFGALHGVVVSPLAHEVEPVAAVSELRLADWEKRIAHLFAELDAVAEALEGRALDFVVLESSLIPALGGIGMAGMAASHAMTDAFAQRHARASRLAWTSAGWDRWLGEEDAAQDLGMAPGEVGAAFETLLAMAGEPVVLLSTGDLSRRAAGAATPAGAASAATTYARPTLATEYHPPATELEERVAEIWEEMLGISPVGAHDDFFGLGGHSLLATQIMSRVRESFALELPLKTIFEAPTVTRFAAVIEAALMAEIEAMSADEILNMV